MQDVHTAAYLGAREGAASVEPVVLGICTLSKKVKASSMHFFFRAIAHFLDFFFLSWCHIDSLDFCGTSQLSFV